MESNRKSMDRKKTLKVIAGATATAFVGLSILAKAKKPDSIYQYEPDQQNLMQGKKVRFVEDKSENINADGVRGHLEAVGKTSYIPSFYERYVKRLFDKALSFGGLVLFAPVMGGIAAAIKIEDPGPALFVQKRVGKDKQYFKLHKFRSMKMSTPHDVPTHMLKNPDQYITRVGHFIRKHSLDELPQIWDIFIGNMSVIGPRPALWNQDLLTAERDKYNANDVKPGLTGWAQINGRDELEIPDKAKFDGEYVENLGPKIDLKCFFGSLHVFNGDNSVIEGGTGEINKEEKRKPSILVICQYYYPENFQITPICEHLARDGYKVTVVTGLPNYPTGIIPEEYKTGHRDEMINGVHVIRCHEIPRGKGAVKLGLNYFSYESSATKKAMTLKDKFDLVFVYQLSPVLMALPGIRYARKYKLPLFLYCCDLWPESMKMYIKNENNPAFKIVKNISRKIYHAADLIGVQSSSFIPYLEKTHDLTKEKLIYMPAFADETYLKKDFTPEDDTTDFVFLGNLGIAQDLISVLKAVEKIKNVPGFKVHFVGDGSVLEEMRQYVKDHELGNIVVFYGRRSVDEMPRYYKLADACLVSLKADNATGLTLPSKVQGYMAAGKPIIGMIDGSAREVIEEAGCGICVGSGDIEGLASAMKNFIEDKDRYKECGEKGRQYFKENFSEGILIERLEKAFSQLIGSKKDEQI